MTTQKPHKVALIEWTHLIEDFLDNIGLTLDDFKEKMTGGWLFGYVEALKTAGVDTVLFCFSARINAPTHFIHLPTGATICILPSPAIYRRIRKVIINPYTQIVEEAVLSTNGWKRCWHSFLLGIAPYCATPLTSLYREIKRHNCTAILCQDYEHARFDVCVPLGKLLKLPVFSTFQGGNWQISKVEKWIRPSTLKACRGLIVASGDEVARVKEKYNLPDGKLKQILNPVDLSMWEGASRDEARKKLGINAGSRVAIWHGRIDYYRKGLDILIGAWEIICMKNGAENFELMLIGSGVNAEILRVRLAQNKLTNITWINEYINDRRKICLYLKASDIYVFPSRNEGFPVAPLEAMACGLPLIAADAPGIPDILPFGESSGGIVLRREDTAALAAALLSLLKNSEKSERLGRLAAAHIQKYYSLQAVGLQLKGFMFKDENK